MSKLKGLDGLFREFNSRVLAGQEASRTKVIVGYRAPYAIYVHENLQMKWRMRARKPNPPHRGQYWGSGPTGTSWAGTSKFLEKTIRRLSKAGTITRVIERAMKEGKTAFSALHAAGVRILKETEPLVPRDFGNLVKSGFVSVRK